MPPVPLGKVLGAVCTLGILWALDFLPLWERLWILFAVWLLVTLIVAWLDWRDRRAAVADRNARLALRRLEAIDRYLRRRHG